MSYSFAGDIVGSRTFFMQLNWHPTFRPEGQEQDGIAFITQGKFLASDNRELKFSIKPTDSIPLAIERNEFERSQLAITIAGKVLIVNLLPRSKYKIATQILTSSDQLHIDSHEAAGDFGKPLCVSIDNNDFNTAIIPSTIGIHYDRKSFVRADVRDSITVDNERLACSQIKAEYQTPFKSFIIIDAYAQAMAFRAIPVEGAKQSVP